MIRKILHVAAAMSLFVASIIVVGNVHAAEGDFSAGQTLAGGINARDVALGLLNNDAHVDAFVAREGGNEVWFGVGDGTFVNSGQNLGNSRSHAVALADFDGDPHFQFEIVEATLD